MQTIRSDSVLPRGNIFRSIDISATGLTAMRRTMDAISSNIANVSTTNVDGQGNPYLRRRVQYTPVPQRSFTGELRQAELRLNRTRPGHMQEGESVTGYYNSTPLVGSTEVEVPNMRKNVIFDPTHPDADANGFVVMPDINILEEMADLIIAQRAFDANITVVDAAKSMVQKALQI